MKNVNRILQFFTVLSFLILAFSSHIIGQSNRVKFDKKVHDFGDILITSGHHTCKFTVTNTSDQPIVIQTIIASCGCTTPEWSRSPIMPNKNGEIVVTFLNDQGPYPFDKVLTVYITGESRPHLLRIKGVVHQNKKSLSELFPEKFSDLSLRRSYIDFGIVPKGEKRVEKLEVANTSKRSITITTSHNSKDISILPKTLSLKPGEKDFLEIELNTTNSSNWGNNNAIINFSINNTKVNKDFTINYNVRDNFFNLSPQEIQNGPIPMASSSSYDFGKINKGGKITSQFRVRNIGKRDLVIHKIDSSIPNISIIYNKNVSVGKSTDINVTIDTKNIDLSGEVSIILTLITNSPTRPIINYIITGNIIK